MTKGINMHQTAYMTQNKLNTERVSERCRFNNRLLILVIQAQNNRDHSSTEKFMKFLGLVCKIPWSKKQGFYQSAEEF